MVDCYNDLNVYDQNDRHPYIWVIWCPKLKACPQQTKISCSEDVHIFPKKLKAVWQSWQYGLNFYALTLFLLSLPSTSRQSIPLKYTLQLDHWPLFLQILHCSFPNTPFTLHVCGFLIYEKTKKKRKKKRISWFWETLCRLWISYLWRLQIDPNKIKK